jgi:hypothetical protein
MSFHRVSQHNPPNQPFTTIKMKPTFKLEDKVRLSDYVLQPMIAWVSEQQNKRGIVRSIETSPNGAQWLHVEWADGTKDHIPCHRLQPVG